MWVSGQVLPLPEPLLKVPLPQPPPQLEHLVPGQHPFLLDLPGVLHYGHQVWQTGSHLLIHFTEMSVTPNLEHFGQLFLIFHHQDISPGVPGRLILALGCLGASLPT